MRRALLYCAAIAFAVACGDSITEPIPDRTQVTQVTPPVAFATTTTEDGLSISTDKDDYQPGDTVHFTGSGWQPGDVLDIVLTDEPLTHEPHTWSVNVEADGMFHDSTYVVDEGDLNVTFTLVATSRATGRSLTVQFTDGQPQSVSLTPASRSVPPGGSAAYNVAVTMGGNNNACTVTLEVISALPAGATAAFSGGANPFNATNVDFSRTLTITTTSGTTPPGTYPFTVRATRGSDCQGTAGTGPTAAGTLIVFGPATKLAFGQQPTNTVSTSSITPAVTVQVLDAGNRLVANSSASITLAIGTNPGGGTLSGTTTQNAVDGVATFANLSIDKIGTGYTLAASSAGLAGATSSAFNITLGDAAQLVFTTQPGGATPGNPLTPQPVVAVQDAGGNVKTNGAGSSTPITLAIVSGTGTPGAVLTCTTNPLTTTNGVASFAGCSINLAGTGYRLRASTTISGTTFTVNSDLFDITANNQAPSVDAGGPYSVAEGTELTLAPTVSDPDGDALSYKWTVNTTGMDAGGACTFVDYEAKNAKLTCTDDSQGAPGGKFTLTLEVNDGNGHTVSDNADLTVTNANPTADAGGGPTGYSGNEGAAIALTGSKSDPGSNDTHTYLWTYAAVSGVDAGATCSFSPSATVLSPSVTCTDDGAFKVMLTVTDDDLGTGSDDATLTLANVDPVAEAGGGASGYSGDEGSPVQLHGSATDAGSNDTFTWSWVYTAGPGALDAGATCTFSSATAKEPTITCTDDGTVTLTLTVTDDDGGSDTDDATLTLANVKPVANAGGPYSGNEGAGIPLNGSADDPGNNDDPYLTFLWTVNTTGIDAGGSCQFYDPANPASAGTATSTLEDPTIKCTDDSNLGTFTLSLVATDDDGGVSVASTATLTVANVAPILGAITAPVAPVNISMAVNVSAPFTDQGTNDTHTGLIDWGDGTTSAAVITESSGSGTASGSHLYSETGVYTITMTVTDDDGAVSNQSIFQYVVVYDPSAGFVTGGGWINSLAGFCKLTTACESAQGKANFGFVSKYLKVTSTVPSGNTEFQFKAGNFNFNSESYEWLLVNQSGTNAQYKGRGTINGVSGYKFMLWATDGAPTGGYDTFRIKIWTESVTGDVVAYDNMETGGGYSTVPIAGGSIVIHTNRLATK